MTGKFYKFKAEYLLGAALKSAVIGITAGLACTGVVMLALKLSGLKLAWWCYVLIAVGAAAVAGGVSFAVFKPTDKLVAKRVDDDHELNERVQTALEFSGADGAVVRMQREDAFARMQDLKTKAPNIKKLWQYPLIFVLALALALTAILIPVKVAEGADDEYVRPPTPFEILAMRELVQNVEDSHLADGVKQPILDDLNGILAGLEENEFVSDVMPAINIAIAHIDRLTKAAASYGKLSQKFESHLLPDLASALKSGDLYLGYAVNTYDQVKSLDSNLISLLSVAVEPNVLRMRESYNDLETTAISPLLLDLIDKMQAALDEYEQSDDDELYGVLAAFKTELDDLRTQIKDGTADETHFQHTLDLAFNSFTDELIDAVKGQSYCLIMGKFVVTRIKIIFGIPIDDKEVNPDASGKDNVPGSGDDDDNRGGGMGGGDTVYGSDDMIYDPETGKYVTYGELLNRYFAIAQEYLGTDELTQEQKDMVTHYFEILFSGIKEAEN